MMIICRQTGFLINRCTEQESLVEGYINNEIKFGDGALHASRGYHPPADPGKWGYY